MSFYADFASVRSGNAGWRPWTISSFIRYCVPAGWSGNSYMISSMISSTIERSALAPVSFSMARWAMAFSAVSVKPSSAFSMANRA